MGEPVVFARSRCPYCGTRLKVRDLIPLWSWLFSRGRCKYCAASLGRFYPLVEIGACLVPISAALLMSGLQLWIASLFGWVLMALAIVDRRSFILPDLLTGALLISGLCADNFHEAK